MKIHKSGQDYLETILLIKRKKGVVRSIDIAQEFGYSKASVSVAMKNLINSGYIEMNIRKEIELTQKGVQLAEKMYERHTFFTQWLEGLGVSHETAVEDACKIEHILSEESFDAIKKSTLI